MEFGGKLVSIVIAPGTYFRNDTKPGDIDLWWAVKDMEGYNCYKGAALVRDGKVHYYDRYPMGGGPFRVHDFKDPTFRRRAEIIADNIERLL